MVGVTGFGRSSTSRGKTQYPKMLPLRKLPLLGKTGGKSDKTMPDYLSAKRESFFPNLTRAAYYKTSEESEIYNCVAYAAGDETLVAAPHFWHRVAGQLLAGRGIGGMARR